MRKKGARVAAYKCGEDGEHESVGLGIQQTGHHCAPIDRAALHRRFRAQRGRIGAAKNGPAYPQQIERARQQQYVKELRERDDERRHTGRADHHVYDAAAGNAQHRADRENIGLPESTLSLVLFRESFANCVRFGLLTSAIRNVGCPPVLFGT